VDLKRHYRNGLNELMNEDDDDGNGDDKVFVGADDDSNRVEVDLKRHYRNGLNVNE